MEITKKNFQKLYHLCYKNATSFYNEGEIEKSIKVIEIMANMAYNTNLFYADDLLEELIKKISEKFVKRNEKISKSTKWVFYDAFGWDNRGLTQQYIRTLAEWNVEFLFIFENFSAKKNKNILAELQENKNATVFIVDKKLSYSKQINSVIEIIEEYQPSKSFLHLTPWSVFSQIIWSHFPEIEKFQINLTDHAFWLGKNILDYCIEFRDYGKNISEKYRGIASEKIFLNPYFPILAEGSSFLGFPKGTEGKKILVSGASYYKVFGENDIFFKILKEIFSKYDDCVLLFAGYGNKWLFNRLLKKYGIESKVILLGDRPDIAEVIKKAYIYIATYPITGGLMGQMAIFQKTPIIGFSDKNLPVNDLESLIKPSDLPLTFHNIDDFMKEFGLLYTDEKYREKKINESFENTFTEKDFKNNLYEIVNNKKKTLPSKNIDIDTNKLIDLYIETENNYLKNFNTLLKDIHLLNKNNYFYINFLFFKDNAIDKVKKLKYKIFSKI